MVLPLLSLPRINVRNTFSHGKKFVYGGLRLIAITSELGVIRYAVIVSKSIDKRASVRNRIRRLIAESLRHLAPNIGSWDMVIIVIGALPQTQIEMEKEVSTLLSRANIL